MKIHLITVLSILALVVGCKWPGVDLTPKKQAAVKSAVAKKSEPAATFGFMPESPADAPITESSTFASICPYCGKAVVSRSCLRSGGQTADGSVIEQWSINYKCRCCKMTFGDYRTQTVTNVNSVRLPIVGK